MTRTLHGCLLALLAGSLASAGCDGQLSPEAVQLLESGKEDYRAGKFAAAAERMDRFLEEHSR